MKEGDKYIEHHQTRLFDKMGVFWAFGDKQFEEQRKAGVEYVQISWLGGLIVPKDNVKQMLKELEEIHKAGKLINRKNYSKEEIIEDELTNQEAYYTGEIDDTVEVLACYGYTYEDVLKVYKETYDQHQE